MITSNPQVRRLRRAVCVVAAILVGAMAPVALTGEPASAQEASAPIITDLAAESMFLMDPCCFVVVEASWSVDPSGPQPDRLRVSFSDGGSPHVQNLPGSARLAFAELRPDRDAMVTVTACVGPVATESCSESVVSVRTASEVVPIIEVTEVVVHASGPDSIQIHWSSGRTNIGVSYAAINVQSTDGGGGQIAPVMDFPATWGPAVPGSTYTVAVQICGGPTPTSVRCGGASTTYTFPQPTGLLSGHVQSSGGPSVASAVVAAYATSDGFMPTALTMTASDGSYSFYGLPEGDYAIFARGLGSYGFAHGWFGGTTRSTAALQTVALGSTLDGLDVVLPDTTRITGTVSEDGVPVAGATVWGYAEGDTWVGSVVAETGPNGTYVLSGVEPGRYQIAVAPPGAQGLAGWFGGPGRSAATWVEVVSEPVSGIEIELSP